MDPNNGPPPKLSAAPIRIAPIRNTNTSAKPKPILMDEVRPIPKDLRQLEGETAFQVASLARRGTPIFVHDLAKRLASGPPARQNQPVGSNGSLRGQQEHRIQALRGRVLRPGRKASSDGGPPPQQQQRQGPPSQEGSVPERLQRCSAYPAIWPQGQQQNRPAVRTDVVTGQQQRSSTPNYSSVGEPQQQRHQGPQGQPRAANVAHVQEHRMPVSTHWVGGQQQQQQQRGQPSVNVMQRQVQRASTPSQFVGGQQQHASPRPVNPVLEHEEQRAPPRANVTPGNPQERAPQANVGQGHQQQRPPTSSDFSNLHQQQQHQQQQCQREQQHHHHQQLQTTMSLLHGQQPHRRPPTLMESLSGMQQQPRTPRTSDALSFQQQGQDQPQQQRHNQQQHHQQQRSSPTPTNSFQGQQQQQHTPATETNLAHREQKRQRTITPTNTLLGDEQQPQFAMPSEISPFDQQRPPVLYPFSGGQQQQQPAPPAKSSFGEQPQFAMPPTPSLQRLRLPTPTKSYFALQQQRAATPTNLVGENKPAQVETPPNTSFMQQQGTPTAPSHGQHQQQQLSTPADSQGPQQPQFLIPGVQSQHGPLTPIKSEIGQYPRFVIPTNYSHSQSSTTSTSQSVLHSRFVIHANPSPDQQQPPTPTNSQHPKFAIPAQSPSAQHPSTTPTNSARPQFIIPSNPPIEQHAQPPSPAVSTRGQHPVFRIPSNSAPDQQNQQLPTALTTTPPRPRRRPIVPKHPVHAQAKRKPIPLSELVGKRPIPVLAKLSRLQRAFVFGPGGCGHVPPVPGDMGVKRMMAVQLPIVRRGELVDLWGPSGCGKTEMIMQMITMTILPESFTLLPSTSGGDSTPLHLHGSATPVLLLDCDLKFSLTKLRNTMLAHITHCLTTLTPALTSLPASTTDIIITSALHRLHIMRPTTNLQFLAALIAARRSFVRACGTPGPLIIIDGLTSYYWINRLDDMGELKAEVTGIPMEDEAEGHLRPAKSFMKSSIHWAVIRAVRRLRDLEHCGVVVSRGVLWPAGRKAGGRWGSNGSNNQKWNGNAPRKGGNAWTPKYADGPWKAVVNRFIVLRRKRASGEVVWYERE